MKIRIVRARGVTKYDVNSELEALKAQKVAEWRARGYPEGLIQMALELAESWTEGIVERWVPEEARREAVKEVYREGLEVADKWLKTMGEAAKAAVVVARAEEEIARLRERYQRKWLKKGYEPELVSMALTFAQEWIDSLVKAYAHDKYIRDYLMVTNYENALRAAEKWLSAMAS